MLENSLFSVLIANYNYGAYLMDAVSSVRNQTYTNWEIIIVDDCSTDNSADIYKTLADDSRIKIYYNEKNSGVGFTKRRLCELANGAFAGFVDADDAIVETALQKMVETHTANNNASLVYSTFYVCDDNLEIKYKSNSQEPIPANQTYLDCTLGKVSHFATFKMKFYNLTEGMNTFFILAEDQDLYYKLEEVGSLVYVDEPMYLYRRINCAGISKSNRNKTLAWGLFAKYEACKRRGLNPDTFFSSIITGEKNIKAFYENSWDYKIGKTILKPYRFLKYKFFSKK